MDSSNIDLLEYRGQFLSVVRLDGGIAEIRLDRQGDALNKLDGAVLAELNPVLARLEADTSLRGVLLDSAKDAFLAGADIQALQDLLGKTAAERSAFCRDMDAVLTRMEDLPVPVVCAINGYALGGGLETALCADYRVLATNAQVGFPEVGLGILPAAGGTVRTPRLAGSTVALEWLAGGRSYKAEAALAAGIVDAVAASAELREVALAWLRRAIAGELDWRARRAQRRGPYTLDAAAVAAARQRAQPLAHDRPAALTIIELLERCAPLSRDESFAHEAEAFSVLSGTPAARALVGIFLSSQLLKKKSREQAAGARPIARAGVVGAGIMGGGVAYTTAVRGTPVLMKDIAQGSLDLGMSEARKLLDKQVESGRLAREKADAMLASIVPTLDDQAFDSVDIIVEAVVENLKVKQDVFAALQARVRPGTVLASNTSSLAIRDIAAPLQRPEDVVGMHFFNPVHMMPLVEIVRSERSSPQAVATTVAYALGMGKIPLVVKDCAGFLVNRILGAYFTAFLQLVRDGVDFVQIDRVMESWGWPMGPAYLIDVAGIDTLEKAMAILGKAYPDVMATDFTTAFQRLAGEKRYGQKTGAGFYRYETDAKGKPRRSGDPKTYELLAQVQPNGPQPLGDEVILDRMMLAMLLEAGRCLDEQVAEGAMEVDAGMRLATGFPAHHGGPLWYADTLGLEEVLRRSAIYRSLGGLYEPGEGFRARAAQGQRLFDAHSN